MDEIKLNRKHFVELQRLILILRTETAPISGHTDPNAINDCWNSLIDITDAMALEIGRSWDHQSYMNEVLNQGDGVYRP